MVKWIFLFSLFIGLVLSHEEYVCEADNDCICNECNVCYCEETGSSAQACTEIGCPQNCDKWETVKNMTEDGRILCDCHCVSYPEPVSDDPKMCSEGDCACDMCNVCTCEGEMAAWGQGTWSCTEKFCIAGMDEDDKEVPEHGEDDHNHETDHEDQDDDHDDDDVSSQQYCEWKARRSEVWEEEGRGECVCECMPPKPPTGGAVSALRGAGLISLLTATLTTRYLW